MNMTRRRYLEALRLVNMSDVARVSGRSLRSLQSYAGGQRRITPEAARELIQYLRTYVHKLTKAADKLEAALTEEE